MLSARFGGNTRLAIASSAIRVPELRRLARRHRALRHRQTLALLRSRWHEDRFLALLILVDRYHRAPLQTAAVRRDCLIFCIISSTVITCANKKPGVARVAFCSSAAEAPGIFAVAVPSLRKKERES